MAHSQMIFDKMGEDQKRSAALTVQATFRRFIQDEQYVGDVYTISSEQH